MKNHFVKLKKYSWFLCLALLIIACLTIGTVLAKYKIEIDVGTFNISIIPNSKAYAVYSDDDNSLVFYYGIPPEEGTRYKEKSVTKVYHNNIATTEYNCNIQDTNGNLATSSLLPEWTDVAESVVSVSFDESFRYTTPVSTSGWFCQFENLISIDCTNLDTSAVTNMKGMFHRCRALQSLDVSDFNTQSVKNMQRMFSSCNNLTNLNINGFNTQGVEDMSFMFSDCELLTALNVSHFVTSNVENMRSMFANCTGLTQLNLNSFDTKKVTNMAYMFRLNSNLVNLDLSNFNTAAVTNMTEMFSSCTQLTSLDISNFDTSLVTTMYMMFKGCSHLNTLNLSSFNTQKSGDMQAMFEDCLQLRKIYVSKTFTLKKTGINVANMFRNCTALEGGSGTTYNSQNENLPFVRIDGMDGKPGYFTGITHPVIDPTTLPGVVWNVNETGYFNEGQESTIVLSTTDGTALPAQVKLVCTKTTNGVDVTVASEIVNVDPTTGIITIPADCMVAESTLSISKYVQMQTFAVYSANDGSLEFFHRSDVPAVNELSPTQKIVTKVYTGCDTEIYGRANEVPWLLDNLSISSVKVVDEINPIFTRHWFNNGNMNFANCTTFDLAKLNMSEVENTGFMFYECAAEILDLSTFDTSKVKGMDQMFYGCTNLKKIIVSDMFVMTAIDTTQPNAVVNMFAGCTSLVGGAETQCDGVNHVDGEYARIDGKDGMLGYFTCVHILDASYMVNDICTICGYSKLIPIYDNPLATGEVETLVEYENIDTGGAIDLPIKFYTDSQYIDEILQNEKYGLVNLANVTDFYQNIENIEGEKVSIEDILELSGEEIAVFEIFRVIVTEDYDGNDLAFEFITPTSYDGTVIIALSKLNIQGDTMTMEHYAIEGVGHGGTVEGTIPADMVYFMKNGTWILSIIAPINSNE